MPVKATSPQQFLDSQALLRQQAPKGASHVVKNASFAADLNEPNYLVYRQRKYKVRPLTFTVGIELQELAVRLESMADQPETNETLQEMLSILQDAVALFWAAAQPLGLLRRLTRHWLSNPFETATNQEVAELLGFFLQSRTRSSVQVLASGRIRHRKLWLSTRQITSADSYERILAGLA